MFSCQSCGMPMDRPEDHGAGNAQSPYCKYCADADGNLLPREIVKDKMIDFRIKAHSVSRDQAEQEIENFMAKMPAWSSAGPSFAPIPVRPLPPSPNLAGSPDIAGGLSKPFSNRSVPPPSLSPASPTPTPSVSPPPTFAPALKKDSLFVKPVAQPPAVSPSFPAPVPEVPRAQSLSSARPPSSGLVFGNDQKPPQS